MPNVVVQSIAGVAMITTAITIAAKATEVSALQIKKGRNEGKSGGQIAKDCFESAYDNGGRIIGATAASKVTASGSNYAYQKFDRYAFPKTYGANKYITFSKFMKGAGGKVIPYVFAAYVGGQTIYSIFSNDPEKRAEQRGYTLK